MTNQKISVLLDSETAQKVENLKSFYSTNTSELIKAAIDELYKNRPVLPEIATGPNPDQTQGIFEKILGLKIHSEKRKTNLFNGKINQKDYLFLFIYRSMCIGESEIINISAKRWIALEKASRESGWAGKILIVYKRCIESAFNILIVDSSEAKEPLFKAKSDGTHFFYIKKVTPEHFSKTRDFLGEYYDTLLAEINGELTNK